MDFVLEVRENPTLSASVNNGNDSPRPRCSGLRSERHHSGLPLRPSCTDSFTHSIKACTRTNHKDAITHFDDSITNDACDFNSSATAPINRNHAGSSYQQPEKEQQPNATLQTLRGSDAFCQTATYLTTGTACDAVDDEEASLMVVASPTEEVAENEKPAPHGSTTSGGIVAVLPTAQDVDGATGKEEPTSPATSTGSGAECPDHIPIDYEAELEDCSHYVFSQGPYCPRSSRAVASYTERYLHDDLTLDACGEEGADTTAEDYIPIDYDEYMKEYEELCADGQPFARPSDGSSRGCTYFTGEEDDIDEDDATHGSADDVACHASACDEADAFGGLCCAPISPAYCSPPVGHCPMSTFPLPPFAPIPSAALAACDAAGRAGSCFVNRDSPVAATSFRRRQQQEEERLQPFSPAWLHKQQAQYAKDMTERTCRRTCRMQEEQNYFVRSHERRSYSLKCFLNEACRQDLRRLQALPASFYANSKNVSRLLNVTASSSPAAALRGLALATPLLSPQKQAAAGGTVQTAEAKKAAVIAEARRLWHQLAERLEEELRDFPCHYRRLVSEFNVLSLFTHNLPLSAAAATGTPASDKAYHTRTQYPSLSAAQHFGRCGTAILREMSDAAVDDMRRVRMERQEAIIAQLQRQGRLFVLPTLRAEAYEPAVPVPRTAVNKEGNEEDPCESVKAPATADHLAASASSAIPLSFTVFARASREDSAVSSPTMQANPLSASNSVIVLTSPKREHTTDGASTSTRRLGPHPTAAATASFNSGSLSHNTFSMGSSLGLEGASSSNSSSGDEWEEMPAVCIFPNLGLPPSHGTAQSEAVPRPEEEQRDEEDEAHACRADTLLADALGRDHEEEEEDEDGFIDLFPARRQDSAGDAVVLSREGSLEVGPEGVQDAVASFAHRAHHLARSTAAFAMLSAEAAGLFSLSTHPTTSHGSANKSSSSSRKAGAALRYCGHSVAAAPQQLSSYLLSTVPTLSRGFGGGVSLSSGTSPSKLFALPAGPDSSSAHTLSPLTAASSHGGEEEEEDADADLHHHHASLMDSSHADRHAGREDEESVSAAEVPLPSFVLSPVGCHAGPSSSPSKGNSPFLHLPPRLGTIGCGGTTSMLGGRTTSGYGESLTSCSGDSSYASMPSPVFHTLVQGGGGGGGGVGAFHLPPALAPFDGSAAADLTPAEGSA